MWRRDSSRRRHAGRRRRPRDVEALERGPRRRSTRTWRARSTHTSGSCARPRRRPRTSRTARPGCPDRRRLRAARRRGRRRADHGRRLAAGAALTARRRLRRAGAADTRTPVLMRRRDRDRRLPALGGPPRRPARGTAASCRSSRTAGSSPSTSTTAAAELPFFGGRPEKWKAIGRMVAHARRGALAAAALRETLDDRHRGHHRGRARSARPATRRPRCAIALETVRTRVRLGLRLVLGAGRGRANVLRFDVESGSAGEEFRKVTLAASFAEGVGLSGRAWRRRDLVFVARPRRGHRLRARPRRPAGRRPLRRLLPDHGRRPGRRHDGLLRHRDHRAVGVARLGAAQRRSSWSRQRLDILRRARGRRRQLPARCWRPCRGCARRPTTPAAWPRARSRRPRR